MVGKFGIFNGVNIGILVMVLEFVRGGNCGNNFVVIRYKYVYLWVEIILDEIL